MFILFLLQNLHATRIYFKGDNRLSAMWVANTYLKVHVFTIDTTKSFFCITEDGIRKSRAALQKESKERELAIINMIQKG